MNPRCLVLDCFTFKISSILKKKLNEKFLFVAAGALLLSAGAFTAHALAKTNVQNSDLINANIEAMADGEVLDSQGNIILRCKDVDGECHTTHNGYGVGMSGTKVD